MADMEHTQMVIALGGNAISRKGEEGNLAQQFARTRESCEFLADFVAARHEIVITHANGPQVGDALRRVELTASEIYPVPLHMCVADTQATMGFMISQCLSNALARRGIERTVSAVLTNVAVDLQDPAFGNPDKPIGKFLSREQAEALIARHGWQMRQYNHRDWRRVVPSPSPRAILEFELIQRLAREGMILICCGGGGIPVTRNGSGEWKGVDCVIDKDRTTAMLAADLGYPLLLIATSVERVCLEYRTPAQRALDRLTLGEAERWLAAGQFPAGTMGPKVEAAIEFLKRSKRIDAHVIISSLERMSDALAGRTGTHIVRE